MLMTFTTQNLVGILAILPAFFWFWFYYIYLAKSEARFRRLFLYLFIIGLATTIPVYTIERFGFIFFQRVSNSIPSFIPGFVPHILPQNFSTVFLFALGSFLFIAPVEEFAKYIGIRLFLYRSLTFDRVIDMIRGGIAIGLGFATAENAIYFVTVLQKMDPSAFIGVFFLRFFISTLAHTLYSAVMGYWLGLAKFHILYRSHFFRYAIGFPIVIHGLLNFSLLSGTGVVSIILIMVVLAITVSWFAERINFQKFIPLEEAKKILPPYLANRREVEGLLYIGNLTYRQIQRLSFCPFCLAKKDASDQERCKNCGAKLSLDKGS